MQTSVGFSCYSFNCSSFHGKSNPVIFLDLKKAFDTILHKIFLSKLDHCGISENSLIKKGFNHIWRIAHNNAQLMGPFICAPQSTILCPLLFLSTK